MAENPSPSIASIQEQLKKSRERQEECATNPQLHRKDLLMARTQAIDLALAHQKAVVQLNEDLEDNAKDIKNVYVHFISEQETILNSCVGALLKEGKKTAAAQPEAPQFVAPLHTPTILCFLKTSLDKSAILHVGLSFFSLNIGSLDASFHYLSPGT
ncbi:hypothetical protein OUZ56_009679 [Daphnia magna]|uniref:Uncharacterized protein n=1 Tax=Daphnia magna TaxID=35525 RepID=A0ABR0AGS3_9CRUS|nr:hypothetical protein OUZ56_009679 [Daphnia magna]